MRRQEVPGAANAGRPEVGGKKVLDKYCRAIAARAGSKCSGGGDLMCFCPSGILREF